MTDLKRLVSLIGKPSDSAEVGAWLQELNAPQPKLRSGDTDASIPLPGLGLELCFSDEASFYRRSDLAIGEGALLLTTVFLKSSKVPNFLDYAGNLPGGLAFGDTRAEVHSKLGSPKDEHDFLPTEFWSMDGLELSIDYDDNKTRAEQVTIWIIPPHERT